MSRARKLFGVFVAAVLVGTALTQTRTAAAATIPKDAKFVPGEVVVVLRGASRTSSALTQARSLARQVGGRVTRVSGRSRAAIIKVGAGADVPALASRLAADPRVRYAEPNYIYRVNAATAPPPYLIRKVQGSDSRMMVSKAALRTMRTRTAAGIKATYPSDKLAFDNAGWDWVNASIVWSNTTASKNVCLIDTGVDYLHTDLTTARVIKGKDFQNEDTDPMDDNGHGTHMAGIIAAKQNNTEGIAGVSPTAKVVAVKATNALGEGSSWNIKQAIMYCTDRTDVSIINLSLGGPYSKMLKDAIEYATLNATLSKRKLVVASAGNESSDVPYCSEATIATDVLKAGVRSYPAGFATLSAKYAWDDAQGVCVPLDLQDPPPANPMDDPNVLHPGYAAVLSVGAGGSDSGEFSCRAEVPGDPAWGSNFGDWVNVTAPGMDILSTTPWDKPFTLMMDMVPVRYGKLSGTSVAAAFVSGAAARAWGYKTTLTNGEIALYVTAKGNEILADDSCWPASMAGATDVNVAAALDRGMLFAEASDAVTGLPLVGATIQAVQPTSPTNSAPVVRASVVLSSVKYTYPGDPATYVDFPYAVDLLNLPASSEPTTPVETTLKVTKSGYTTTYVEAFVGGGKANGKVDTPWGQRGYGGYAAVPPKSARFTGVSAWDYRDWNPVGQVWYPKLTTSLPDAASKSASPDKDGQTLDFVVGHDVCGTTTLEGDTNGELDAFPMAQVVYPDWVDTHQIVERKVALSSTLPINVAQPWYLGEYVFRVHNPANPDIPSPGGFVDRQGSLFVWKDAALKLRVNLNSSTAAGCDDAANDWWEAAKIVSGKTGSAAVQALNMCSQKSGFIIPYPASCP